MRRIMRPIYLHLAKNGMFFDIGICARITLVKMSLTSAILCQGLPEFFCDFSFDAM